MASLLPMDGILGLLFYLRSNVTEIKLHAFWNHVVMFSDIEQDVVIVIGSDRVAASSRGWGQIS
jgi:hypothetical protein